jgi:ubiquinone/menaquinone biosynthesis C-methylase UbiE
MLYSFRYNRVRLSTGATQKIVGVIFIAGDLMKDDQFWANYFLTYDLLSEALPYQKLLDDLIKALEVKKGDLILDAGSGTGNLSILLKEYGAKPTGYDFSGKALEIHLRKDKDAELYLGDLRNKLPFSDNYFDKIVSNNVIYTISKPDRLAILKEFYRILKHNGRFVIANVHTRFNPLVIFKDHLTESIKTNGASRTINDLIVKGYGLAKLFYYSIVLIKQHKDGKYAFLEKDEQKNLLIQVGFKIANNTINSYSNQSYIDIGVK